MATPKLNAFTEFDLTDEEQFAGQLLSHNQLMVIQNLRAEYAVKKINLAYTPSSHQEFLQQEAEISGWMNCLNYILECHEVSAAKNLQANSENNPESGNDSITIFQG